MAKIEKEHFTLQRDAIHLPNDAGQYEQALTAILNRIPNGWGRWISCDKGWYSIITKLDRDLAGICPEYEVHQVKEKFGVLRYYFEVPAPKPACCVKAREEQEKALGSRPKRLEFEDLQYSEWWERYDRYWDEHRKTVEHKSSLPSYEEEKKRDELYQKMRVLVDKAEEKSSRTCELTGEPGILMQSGRDGWGSVKTLDPSTSPVEYQKIVAPKFSKRENTEELKSKDMGKLDKLYEKSVLTAEQLHKVAQRLLDKRLGLEKTESNEKPQ